MSLVIYLVLPILNFSFTGFIWVMSIMHVEGFDQHGSIFTCWCTSFSVMQLNNLFSYFTFGKKVLNVQVGYYENMKKMREEEEQDRDPLL